MLRVCVVSRVCAGLGCTVNCIDRAECPSSRPPRPVATRPLSASRPRRPRLALAAISGRVIACLSRVFWDQPRCKSCIPPTGGPYFLGAALLCRNFATSKWLVPYNVMSLPETGPTRADIAVTPVSPLIVLRPIDYVDKCVPGSVAFTFYAHAGPTNLQVPCTQDWSSSPAILGYGDSQSS
ncbi:hypothetical protein J6590_008355 [Homalodisca vitripennis]|nr:hypothetical protein J6590_008355 [Homalodisca vitripennis]